MVCGHHCHCLWPSWLWPSLSLFVAIMIVAIMVIVCGHHGLWPSLSNPLLPQELAIALPTDRTWFRLATRTIITLEPCTGRKYQARPGPVHCRKIQARPSDWSEKPGTARSCFSAYCWHKPKHNSAICLLNIINSPTGEARARSGDGVIESLHLQGRRKGWCGREGGGCGPQKCCMRPTSQAVC